MQRLSDLATPKRLRNIEKTLGLLFLLIKSAFKYVFIVFYVFKYVFHHLKGGKFTLKELNIGKIHSVK